MNRGDVQRGSRSCRQCGNPFVPGGRVHSELISKESTWTRLDRCDQCFEGADPQSIAVWHTQVPDKKQGLRLSEDAIWQVLTKAAEDAELRAKPFTYILCLMLARKRKLRVIGRQRRRGREIQVFSNISRGVQLPVELPNLTPATFAHLQEELNEFLSEAH